MCLIDSSTCKLEEDSNALLSSNLNNESNNVIQSSEFNYKFKFKIIDFLIIYNLDILSIPCQHIFLCYKMIY